MGNIADYINKLGGVATFDSNTRISKRIIYDLHVSEQDRKTIEVNGF